MTALLTVRQMTKSFGGLTVNRDVDMALATGDRVALIGPNGAGKTTLINLITGAQRPTRGQVLLADEDVTAMSVAARVRKGLVRSFQVTRLFSDMTVRENLVVAVLQRQACTGRMLAYAGAMRAAHAAAGESLETLGLAGVADQPVSTLAYGQRRLLEIAIALALKPTVLLLDEPGAGVPRDELPHVLRAMAQLPDGIAVLMVEHDMDLVFRFARRVLVLASGRLIFEGSPSALATDVRVREAYLGSEAHARRHA